jgi:hypothetical protein
MSVQPPAAALTSAAPLRELTSVVDAANADLRF